MCVWVWLLYFVAHFDALNGSSQPIQSAMTCMRFCKASTKMRKWTYALAHSVVACWLLGLVLAKSTTSKGLKTLNCAICICNDLLHCIYRALALLHSFGSMICSARCTCVPFAYILCVCVCDGFVRFFFCTFIIKQLLNAKFEYTHRARQRKTQME